MDTENLRKRLSDDLDALRRGKRILGIDEYADELDALGPSYRFHARAVRDAKKDDARLAAEIAKVIDKLDRKHSGTSEE